MKITKKQIAVGGIVILILLAGLYVRLLLPVSKTVLMQGEKVVLSEKHPEVMYEYKLTGNENADVPSEDVFHEIKSKYQTVWKEDLGFANGFTDSVEVTEYKATNGDTYKIDGDVGLWSTAILKKNGQKVWQDNLIFTTYDPMRLRFMTGNTFVLAYHKYDWNDSAGYKPPVHNVIYNEGINANASYGFTSSFAPASITSKPGTFYFFAEDAAKKSYLVIGEKKYELPYSGIIDPPCCSPAMFAVNHNGEQTAFFGKKNGSWYYVIINVKNLVDNK